QRLYAACGRLVGGGEGAGDHCPQRYGLRHVPTHRLTIERAVQPAGAGAAELPSRGWRCRVATPPTPVMSHGVLVLLILVVSLGAYLWFVELPGERTRVESE